MFLHHDASVNIEHDINPEIEAEKSNILELSLEWTKWMERTKYLQNTSNKKPHDYYKDVVRPRMRKHNRYFENRNIQVRISMIHIYYFYLVSLCDAFTSNQMATFVGMRVELCEN
jgi:hypothetical protein